MKQFSIPKENDDLRRFVSLKYVKFFTVWGLYAVVIILLEIFYMHGYFVRKLGDVNAWGIAVILVAAPFFAAKGYRLLLDRTWEGIIYSVKYTTRVEPITKYTFSRVFIKREYCELYVNTDDNRRIKCMLLLDSAKLTLPIEKDDRIRHYRGLEYPVLVGRAHMICPICGCGNEPDADRCSICRHSVIH